MASGFFDTSILASHNHTPTPGDGGVLTNLAVTGVVTETGTPVNPTDLSTIAVMESNVMIWGI